MSNQPWDPTCISAEAYNNIASYDTPEANPLTEEILHDLQPLFVKHHLVDTLWGVEFVHRHRGLRDGEIMLQTRVPEGLLSRPVGRAGIEFYPRAIYLNHRGQFQAFEFSDIEPRLSLSEDFLVSFREFLLKRELGREIGLSYHSDTTTFDEYETTSGMICKARTESSSPAFSSVAAWTCSSDTSGNLVWRARRACEDKGGGRHHDPANDSGI